MPNARPHPPAAPHGSLREVLPDVFFVTGTMAMSVGIVPVRFSRNMTVIREGTRLVLVNSVRLDDAGLAALDALGKVTDVIRLAGFHGMDDPFYAERYGAKVWALAGQSYVSGFDPKALQNWAATDEYFSLLGNAMMRLGGFLKAHNVGPAWLQNGKPPKGELQGILELPFVNLLPAHGTPVIGGARELYRPAIERAVATL